MAATYIYTADAPPLEPVRFSTKTGLFDRRDNSGPYIVGPNGARLYNPGRLAVMLSGAVGRLQITAGGISLKVERELDLDESICHCLGTLHRPAEGEPGFQFTELVFVPNYGLICGMNGGAEAVLDFYAGPLAQEQYTTTPYYIEIVDLNQSQYITRRRRFPSELEYTRVYVPKVLLSDEFDTCASSKSMAHIARLTYKPATGELVLNTGTCQHLQPGDVCGPGPEPTPFVVNAPYKWCGGGTGGAVYSKTADPGAGSLLFSAPVVRDVLQPGETEADAEARLSVATVASTTEREYIVTDAGVFYWREGNEDHLYYNPVYVKQLGHPRGLLANLFLEYSGSTVVGGTTGRIFAAACPTDTPTPEQGQTYSVTAQKLSDGYIWQSKKLIVGNYNPHGQHEEQPYLVDTGATAQAWEWYEEESGPTVNWYTLYQMAQFSGATFSAAAYVPAYYHDDETQTHGITVTIGPPELDPPYPDESHMNPSWMNEDWTSVRRLTFTAFQHDGLWYTAVGQGADGYVFDNVALSEAWKLSPCIGVGGMLYTRNTDGTSDRSVAYSSPDFTGGTTTISSTGTGVYSITTTGGATYYSGRSNADPAQLF